MTDEDSIKVVIRYVSFPDGKEIGPRTEFTPALGGHYEHLAKEIYKIGDDEWIFKFWTLEEYSRSRIEQGLLFENTAFSSQTASAWYQFKGKSKPSASGFTPYTFSSAQNEFKPKISPIQSVSPGKAFVGKMHVSTKTDVEVTPKTSIKFKYYETFDNWVRLGERPITDKVLKVKKGRSPFVIAYYSPPPGSDPQPYIEWLRHLTKYIETHYRQPPVKIPPLPDPPMHVKKQLGLTGDEWKPEWYTTEFEDEKKRKRKKHLR